MMTELDVPRARYRSSTKTEKDDEARQCWELRLAGHTIDQIALMIERSTGTVINRLKHAAALNISPLVEQWRTEEVAIADNLWRERLAQQPRTDDGRVIVDSALISDRLALSAHVGKVLGGFTPVVAKADVTVTHKGPLDAELEDLMNDLGLADQAAPTDSGMTP